MGMEQKERFQSPHSSESRETIRPARCWSFLHEDDDDGYQRDIDGEGMNDDEDDKNKDDNDEKKAKAKNPEESPEDDKDRLGALYGDVCFASYSNTMRTEQQQQQQPS